MEHAGSSQVHSLGLTNNFVLAFFFLSLFYHVSEKLHSFMKTDDCLMRQYKTKQKQLYLYHVIRFGNKTVAAQIMDIITNMDIMHSK